MIRTAHILNLVKMIAAAVLNSKKFLKFPKEEQNVCVEFQEGKIFMHNSAPYQKLNTPSANLKQGKV